MLYGTPGFGIEVAEKLQPEQMAEAVLSLQGEIQHPLTLSNGFVGEFLNLDTLTLIDGPSFEEKYEVLLMLMNAIQPYQRLVVIDPIGVFSPVDGVTVLSAAHDIRLSLVEVGMKRVLAGVAESLPEALHATATQYLAGFLADAHDFMAFDTLLNRVRMDGTNPSVLAVLETLERQSVFANERTNALSLEVLQRDALVSVDVSGLAEPWKTLFYEEAITTVLSDAGGDVVPVLIYPENYLKQLSQLVRKADEADLTMLMLASPYLPEDIESMADNIFHTGRDARVSVVGSLTYGLPVALTLTGEDTAIVIDKESEEFSGSDYGLPGSDFEGLSLPEEDLPRSDFEGLEWQGEEETPVVQEPVLPELPWELPEPEPVDVTSEEPVMVSATDELWQPPPITETPEAPMPEEMPLETLETETALESDLLPKPESRSIHTIFDDDDAWQVPDESESRALGDFDSILGTADELPKTDYDVLPPPSSDDPIASAEYLSEDIKPSAEEGEFDSILGGFEEAFEEAKEEALPPVELPPEVASEAVPETVPETAPDSAPDWQQSGGEEFDFDLSLAEAVEVPPLETAEIESTLPEISAMPSPESPALEPITAPIPEAAPTPPPTTTFPPPESRPASSTLPPPDDHGAEQASQSLHSLFEDDSDMPPPLPPPDASLPPPDFLSRPVETDPTLWEPPQYYQPPTALPADMPLPPPIAEPSALPADMPLPPPIADASLMAEPSALPADMPLPPPIADASPMAEPLALPADMPLPPPIADVPPMAEPEEEFNFPDEGTLAPPGMESTGPMTPPDAATDALEPMRVEPELVPVLPENALPVVQKPETSSTAGNGTAFHAGDQVRHEEYGIGIVNKVIPMEGSVVLNITFEHVGKRLMDPALSELQKV